MSVKGSWGANATSQTFKNPLYIGVSSPTQQYPSGSFSFNFTNTGTYRKAWQRISGTSTNISITFYLCDSSGNNKVKLCKVSGFTSQASFLYTPISGTITNTNQLLTGTKLYVIATGDTSYIGTYGAIELTISTATKKYTLTTASSPSAGGTTSGGGSYAYGASRSISATANTGYIFNNWTKTGGTIANANNASTTITIPASNVTATANFTHVSYTLSGNTNPEDGGTVTLGANTGYYNSQITVTATPEENYSFYNWTSSGGSFANPGAATTTFTMPNSNAVITANFIFDAYYVYTASNPANGGTVTTNISSAYPNDEIILEAIPSPGYQFSGWSTSPSVTIIDNIFLMPESNVTVTANFSKLNYNIYPNVYPNNAGSITVSPSIAQLGDIVTITKSLNDGFVFNEYISDPAVTIVNDQFTMVPSELSLVAMCHGVPTTCTLNASSYAGGDTATLSLTGATDVFTHRYKLSFGKHMNTGWVNIPFDTDTININIPVEWGTHIVSGTSVSGGTLTLETRNGETLIGEYAINNLTYSALNNTIPEINVWRCDSNGNAQIDGEYGRYSLSVPEDITNYSITCDGTTVQRPAVTGDILPNNKKQFAKDVNHLIGASFTYGAETFIVRKDIPKTILVKKVL